MPRLKLIAPRLKLKLIVPRRGPKIVFSKRVVKLTKKLRKLSGGSIYGSMTPAPAPHVKSGREIRSGKGKKRGVKRGGVLHASAAQYNRNYYATHPM